MTQTPIGPSGVDELIGERVHSAMWRARITQTQMAKALGVDQAAVSRRLRGRTPWRVTDILAAAEICGLTIEDLMPTHDELGHAGGLTRRNAAAESKCTQAPAKGTPRQRAAQAWGQVDLLVTPLRLAVSA